MARLLRPCVFPGAVKIKDYAGGDLSAGGRVWEARGWPGAEGDIPVSHEAHEGVRPGGQLLLELQV